jgi:hypothetical protein
MFPSMAVPFWRKVVPWLRKRGERIMNSTPINDVTIPQKTRWRGFSLKKKTESKNKKMGCEDAIMGALILSVFGSAKKKKEMFMVIEKNAPRQISNNCFFVREYFLNKIKGRNNSAAKKKRMKARVNGGIFSNANLKIGAAPPQIMFVMIKATTGFMCTTQFINLFYSRHIIFYFYLSRR